MKLKREEIGIFPRAVFLKMPPECVEAKTITLNKMNVLTIFKDRRLSAVQYLTQLFAAIGIPQSDKMVYWFYNEMPDNGYLEMDYPTGRLCLCVLEKI